MRQPIAGVAPPELKEVTAMVVWPSVSAFALGRLLGRGFAVRWPDAYVLRLGNLIALGCIPLGLLLYFFRLAPRHGYLVQWPCKAEEVNPENVWAIPLHGFYYRLTNRRVLQHHNELTVRWTLFFGIPLPVINFAFQQESKSVSLDRFDSIEVQVQDGQQWYEAGDLVFLAGGTETFRLTGVSRPEAFRQCCLKSRMAYVGVKAAKEREALVAS